MNINSTQFIDAINPRFFTSKSQSKIKSEFIDQLLIYQASNNYLIKEFSMFGLYMCEHGTRKNKSRMVNTIFRYLSIIKIFSSFDPKLDLSKMDKYELTSIYEFVQDKFENKKEINSALLNLFTYLKLKYNAKLCPIDLSTTSIAKIDANVIWPSEAETFINADYITKTQKTFTHILYDVGCRNIEAHSLFSRDVDAKVGLLHFRSNAYHRMKNFSSTRYFPFSKLSAALLCEFENDSFFKRKANNIPIFGDETYRTFIKFSSDTNKSLKKHIRDDISIKLFRHTKARAFFINIESNSIREHFQYSAYIGHANIGITHKHYIQSVYEKNELIEISDADTQLLLNITFGAFKKRKERLVTDEKNSLLKNSLFLLNSHNKTK